MRDRFSWQRLLLLATLGACTGCSAGTAAFAAFAVGASIAAIGSQRRRAMMALHKAYVLRKALESGQQRRIEHDLRRLLAMAKDGGVSLERQWLARAQLGGLLAAEWRLDEAAEIYSADDEGTPPLLRALTCFGRHEVAILRTTPTPEQLEQIRADAQAVIGAVPTGYREEAAEVWGALEGLCLARMGLFHDAIPLLQRGVDRLLELSPARIIYAYHLAQAMERSGDLSSAQQYYEIAMKAFPGTRLASDASARLRALGPAGERTGFRGMLPESPEAASPPGGPPSPPAPTTSRAPASPSDGSSDDEISNDVDEQEPG